MDIAEWRRFRDGLRGLPAYALADRLVEFKKSGMMSYRAIEREIGIPKETVIGWVSAGRVPPPWVSVLLLYVLEAYAEQGGIPRACVGRPRLKRRNDGL